MKWIIGINLLATASLAASTPQWSQFRGPNASGVAAEARPPIHFDNTTNLLWKVAVSSGHSSPCLWNDRIFLTAYDQDRQKLETICLERATGAVLWRHDAPTETIEKVHEISSPVTATPATDGKAVYVYFSTYGLLAYDFAGAVLWQKPLPTAITFGDFGSGTSPIVAGDRVILDMHLDKDSHLLAVRCDNGETLWKAPKPLFNGGWSTPITWREGERSLVGILNAGRFTAYDLTDGTERWWITDLPAQICATPVAADGMLYLTGAGVQGETDNMTVPPPFDDVLARYDQNQDGRISTDELPDSLLLTDRKTSNGAGNMSVKQVILMIGNTNTVTMDRDGWADVVEKVTQFKNSSIMKSCALAVRCGGTNDATATQVVWRETRGIPEVPSPLLYRNHLYYVKNGGIVICRDAATGKSLYEERLGAAGGYYASPVAADGRIYTASDRGVVTVFEAGDELHVLAHNDLQEPIMATPAPVEKNLYVRTANRLYAFGR